MKALGMIEVIGLPPAIEAADAALKAANVTLLAIAKADAGIMTVEITGDVSAVTAAVEAGAAAASRIGTLRAKHVIPNVDESLAGKVIMQGPKLFQPKNKPINPTSEIVKGNDLLEEAFTIGRDDAYGESTLTETPDVLREEMPEENPEEKSEEISEEISEGNSEEKPEETLYTAAELKKKSNDTLRGILQSQGTTLTEQHKIAKKQELIQLILANQNNR